MQGQTNISLLPCHEQRDWAHKTVKLLTSTVWEYEATEKCHVIIATNANTSSWCYSYIWDPTASAYITLDWIYHSVSGYGCASCNYTLYTGDKIKIQSDRSDSSWKITIIPIVLGG